MPRAENRLREKAMQIGPGMQAVVTGGASGLGRAVAEALVDQGLDVTVFDLAEPAEMPRVRFARVDVTDPDSLAKGFDALGPTPLRLAVACAGIAPSGKTISRGAAHDPAVFARAVAVNLTGSFLFASQAALRMSAAEPLPDDGERGVIILTASVAAFDGQVGQAAYAASKGGVAALTLPMARDLAPLGIRVVTVAPGLFRTPMLEGLPAEVQASLGQQVPFPSRLGLPGEFAALVLHAAANPMLNGEVIRLDGAIRMAPR